MQSNQYTYLWSAQNQTSQKIPALNIRVNGNAHSLSLFMPESHERILRRINRRFGSFPTRTYSNRISNNANDRITYVERSANLSDVSPYVGVRWQIYGRVTGALVGLT